ncbi:MAG: flotillin family protein [Polyangiales bacterium]
MQQYGQPDPYYGGSGLDVTSPEPGFTDALAGDSTLWSVVFTALGIAVAILVFAAIARSLLHIARPNEALVFSGKKYRRSDGTMLPYRILRQGERAFRIPVLERVDRMDMRLLPIDIVVQNAYSAGNIPLQIHAIANVKVASDERFIGNAVERFLGRSVREIQQVAQQTLEGAVREVIATLTPEQVNEDRLAFAERLAKAAEDDLAKLGLTLDVLKIQTGRRRDRLPRQPRASEDRGGAPPDAENSGKRSGAGDHGRERRVDAARRGRQGRGRGGDPRASQRASSCPSRARR